ncbi:hypothetical protein HMPREF3148_04235 [Corynebacterium sp. HMSC05D08]|uniref:hypothetical protein n=1 Tax=Corynebacterium sp. HMSC05D08 TaxID=1581116 RepID=UPI0008A272B1|nr:hypothetical protein [Corynebacterium sp. HMSC05D08]OFT64089.1 hypothetical protein HMPREF3148_04235 [Corynebacterium sp. HMSC05D08]
MPVVSGSLVFVTSRPSAVSEVWVRARDVRTSVQGVVVESNDRIPVANGVVSFEVLPGPAVLTLVEAGRPVDTIPIVVGDASEQSLMDVVDAALIVDESQASVIESLAAQVVADAHAAAAAAAEAKESQVASSSSASAAEGSASAADVSAKAAKASQDAAAGSASSAKQSESNAAAFKNAADSSASDAATSAGSAKKSEDAAKAAQARSEEIASSTSWDGDKLTVNGKTSPSLRGPKGDKGETGSVENVSWDDISGKPDLASTWEQVKGKPAAFPPTTHTHTTAQVEGLDDALAGKADKGHTHKVEDVDGLKERLDQQDGAARDVYASLIDVRRKLTVKADESYVKSQIASTRSYVDRAVADGSKIKVVSSLPSYPDSSTVYIVV